MTDARDQELDGLFRALPTEFVAARDALSAQRKARGDKAGAASVKALKRPTPGAWALNQLHFRGARSLDEARRATDAVRMLHARDGVSPQELRTVHEAQRSAHQRVTDEALRLCEEAGLPGGPQQAKKFAVTLQGVLSGLGDEPLGRMTHDLTPSGFDAISSLGAPVVRSVAALPAEPEAEAKRERERAIQAADARVQASETALARQRTRVDKETRELESMARRLRELTAQLTQAREAESERRAALATLETELEALGSELVEARAARSSLD